jgi:hypothetical protein
MKKLVCLYFLSFALLLNSCATTNIDKNIIKDTESIAQDIEFIRRDFYLKIHQNLHIWKVVGTAYNGNSIGYAGSGTYDLIVQYNTGRSYTLRVPLTCTFEKGKSYFLNCNVEGDKVTIFLEELSNNIYQEKKDYLLSTYLTFSQKNPTYLEGTWRGDSKLQKPLFLTFNGNHITVIQDNFGPDIHYEGNFYYDDKSIIVFFEKNNQSQIWYYELKDGYLNILKGKIFSTGWNINNQYVKEN